ncbi:tryptophan dimethylallyltransferase-domain-containing protein [Aspergillus flavus]|uniref:Tryptophan dimethylallyltransferase-domain-containing protein n=2 Tax=Aspergillus flavus TaxID=5059 RepID=A0A7U2MQT9_ASPFN|nr:tryptophan dimethylallyltransferase-domain-containing protein [Aspergillus flavus]
MLQVTSSCSITRQSRRSPLSAPLHIKLSSTDPRGIPAEVLNLPPKPGSPTTMHIPCPLSPTNFEALTEELEFSNENWKQWCYKTGPILLKLMTSSIYSIERQHQYLEFYVRVIIACLGPYPQVVRSSLTQSGLPVEFSVNYQQHGKQPTVRIAFEPLSGARGTEPVAYDRDIAKKFLSTLSELELKGFDSRLWDTVSQDIHLDATEKAILQENNINDTYLRTQTLFGIDFCRRQRDIGKSLCLSGVEMQNIWAVFAGIIGQHGQRPTETSRLL